MSNANKTKTDNIAGVMYETARKSKIKNPRFKASFIATIPHSKNYGKTVHALMNHYRKNGELKCACCGADNVYFRFCKDKGRVIFKAYVKKKNTEQLMTVDHDLLKSLGGSNSVNNFNPMCYSCNQLRGSRFAEFREFKDWYDNQKVLDTIAGLPNANFCFIDYSLNKNNNQFFDNVVGSSVLPPKLIELMKKNMRSPKPDVFSHISIKELISLERNYANKLLNELVYERSLKCEGCRDIPIGEHDFFTGCDSSIHRKIKLYIQDGIDIQLRKRRHKQKEFTAQKHIVESSVQEVNKSFTFKYMWNKFTNIFA